MSESTDLDSKATTSSLRSCESKSKCLDDDDDDDDMSLEEEEDPNKDKPLETTSPKKYSQKYFQDRIKTLQAEIVKQIPSKEDLIGFVFSPLVEGIETALEGLEVANALKKKLEAAQRQNPEDAEFLKDLKQVLSKSEASLEKLNESAANAGTAIVHDSGLVLKLMENLNPLYECTILIQATPQKLSQWVSDNPTKHAQLLDKLLFIGGGRNSLPLAKAFLDGGGPSHGNYGPALVIYDQLQTELVAASGAADELQDSDLVQRLALAVALELATPISIFHNDDEFVDPVERFRYYAKLANPKDAYLDSAFYDLDVWELRKVVDANATHDDLQWGRDFLQNYRPDQITMQDQKWRYVESVRTDVSYRHPDHEFDTYQQLISAGGECGPRAFFGRFVSKAWGIPTWGVRQPGHAAMTRYTKDSGWVVCLGADWPYSWWDEDRYYGGDPKGRQRKGPDFLEETRARKAPGYPQEVLWLECLAEVLGETIEEHFVATKFWRNLALAQRKFLARQFTTNEESSSTSEERQTTKRHLEPHTKKVDTREPRNPNTIVIPAESFVDPEKPNKNAMILDSYSGGKQLHLEHNGAVIYELPDDIEPGTYYLSAKVVNVHRMQQPILIEIQEPTFEDFDYVIVVHDDPQYLLVPYTHGYWGETPSISIDLVGTSRGKIKISRQDPCWGLSIKEFYLTPTTTKTTNA